MSMNDENQIIDLRSAVTDLTEALLLSERRTSRLERKIHWGILTVIIITGMIAVILLRPFDYALAQQPMEPSRSVESAIDRLTQNLTGQQSTLGMMGQMMFQMVDLGTRRAIGEAEQIPSLTEADCAPGALLSPELQTARIRNQLGFFVKCHFVQTGKSNPQPQDYQQAVMSAVTGAAVDLGILVARVRDDSDVIRNFIVNYTGDSNQLLQMIGSELELLNKTLSSVPVMTANMNTMTHQMGIMATDMSSMRHSMGSTMGRMGNWMPW